MISVILKNKQKTKQKQISKIEKTIILIEIPKTQNKNKSNQNLPNKKTQLKVKFYTQTYKNEKKLYRCRCQSRQSGGRDLARERTVYGSDELCALSLLIVADFSLSPVSTPCLLCLPFCLGFGSTKSVFETF